MPNETSRFHLPIVLLLLMKLQVSMLIHVPSTRKSIRLNIKHMECLWQQSLIRLLWHRNRSCINFRGWWWIGSCSHWSTMTPRTKQTQSLLPSISQAMTIEVLIGCRLIQRGGHRIKHRHIPLRGTWWPRFSCTRLWHRLRHTTSRSSLWSHFNSLSICTIRQFLQQGRLIVRLWTDFRNFRRLKRQQSRSLSRRFTNLSFTVSNITIWGFNLIFWFNIFQHLPIDSTQIQATSHTTRLQLLENLHGLIDFVHRMLTTKKITTDMVRCTTDQLSLIGQPVGVFMTTLAGPNHRIFTKSAWRASRQNHTTSPSL